MGTDTHHETYIHPRLYRMACSTIIYVRGCGESIRCINMIYRWVLGEEGVGG